MKKTTAKRSDLLVEEVEAIGGGRVSGTQSSTLISGDKKDVRASQEKWKVFLEKRTKKRGNYRNVRDFVRTGRKKKKRGKKLQKKKEGGRLL